MAASDLQGRPRSRQGLSAWYTELLTDQESSGMSVAQYAVAWG